MITPVYASAEDIAATDPFGGKGLQLHRENVPPASWEAMHLGAGLAHLSGGQDIPVVVFPDCAWVKEPDAGLPESMGEALRRWLCDNELKELPRPADIYGKLRRGETLSLKEVSHVLRQLVSDEG
jgi:hypothetical protein